PPTGVTKAVRACFADGQTHLVVARGSLLQVFSVVTIATRADPVMTLMFQQRYDTLIEGVYPVRPSATQKSDHLIVGFGSTHVALLGWEESTCRLLTLALYDVSVPGEEFLGEARVGMDLLVDHSHSVCCAVVGKSNDHLAVISLRDIAQEPKLVPLPELGIAHIRDLAFTQEGSHPLLGVLCEEAPVGPERYALGQSGLYLVGLGIYPQSLSVVVKWKVGHVASSDHNLKTPCWPCCLLLLCRVLHTQRRQPAWYALNRHGMPPRKVSEAGSWLGSSLVHQPPPVPRSLQYKSWRLQEHLSDTHRFETDLDVVYEDMTYGDSETPGLAMPDTLFEMSVPEGARELKYIGPRDVPRAEKDTSLFGARLTWIQTEETGTRRERERERGKAREESRGVIVDRKGGIHMIVVTPSAISLVPMLNRDKNALLRNGIWGTVQPTCVVALGSNVSLSMSTVCNTEEERERETQWERERRNEQRDLVFIGCSAEDSVIVAVNSVPKQLKRDQVSPSDYTPLGHDDLKASQSKAIVERNIQLEKELARGDQDEMSEEEPEAKPVSEEENLLQSMMEESEEEEEEVEDDVLHPVMFRPLDAPDHLKALPIFAESAVKRVDEVHALPGLCVETAAALEAAEEQYDAEHPRETPAVPEEEDGTSIEPPAKRASALESAHLASLPPGLERKEGPAPLTQETPGPYDGPRLAHRRDAIDTGLDTEAQTGDIAVFEKVP
ncbi:hypothetical protein KIPB_006268, partial [Kipferlia bialata]